MFIINKHTYQPDIIQVVRYQHSESKALLADIVVSTLWVSVILKDQ